MPTYHSPSSSPSGSPSPHNHRRRRRSPSSASFSSRSRSLSRSPSPPGPNRPARRLRDRFPDDGLSESKSESIIKTSLVFLGAVGAATLAAHKFWPKGITYGEREEWECERKKEVRRAEGEAGPGSGRERGGPRRGREGGGGRRERGGSERGGRGAEGGGRGERGGGGGGRSAAAAGAGAGAGMAAGYAGSSASAGSGGGRGEREGERGRSSRHERDGGRGRGRSTAGAYYAREEVVVRDKSVGVDVGRARSQLRERSVADRGREYRAADRADSPPFVVERRTRREVDYYPPSPPRLVIERVGGSARSRARSVVYGDEPEVVYVRREPAPAGRYSSGTASVADARPRSWYGNEYHG